jgi:hypothetical protein
MTERDFAKAVLVGLIGAAAFVWVLERVVEAVMRLEGQG